MTEGKVVKGSFSAITSANSNSVRYALARAQTRVVNAKKEQDALNLRLRKLGVEKNDLKAVREYLTYGADPNTLGAVSTLPLSPVSFIFPHKLRVSVEWQLPVGLCDRAKSGGDCGGVARCRRQHRVRRQGMLERMKRVKVAYAAFISLV